MKKLLVLSLVAGSAAGTPSIANAKSFLWRISGRGSTSYVLGSIHMGKKGFYPLAPAVERAFKTSAVLVMEARPDKLLKPLMSMFRHGIYMPPDTLQKHLSAKTYRKVVKAARAVGLPQMAIDRFRPWTLAMTLSALQLQKLGYNPQLGIEMHLMGRAKTKKIDVLEGVEFQMKLFASFSDAEQEAFLLLTLGQADQAKTMMTKMVRAWKRGDTATMERLMSKATQSDPRFKAIEKRLIGDRNVSMAKTIHRMLSKSNDVHLFVVGAGHLVGKNSIVKQLHQMGYILRQL